MSSPSVLKVPCVCGALMRVNETGSGGFSTSCPDCKAQAFYKGPKSVAAFRSKYSAAPAPANEKPTEKPKGGGLIDGL